MDLEVPTRMQGLCSLQQCPSGECLRYTDRLPSRGQRFPMFAYSCHAGDSCSSQSLSVLATQSCAAALIVCITEHTSGLHAGITLPICRMQGWPPCMPCVLRECINSTWPWRCRDGSVTASTSARTSLIPETLEDMQQDAEFQQTAERLARLGQGAITREERRQRQRSLDKMGVPGFGTKLKVRGSRGKNGMRLLPR